MLVYRKQTLCDWKVWLANFDVMLEWARLPSLWMQARLKVTLLWFSHLNENYLALGQFDLRNKSREVREVCTQTKQGHLQPRCHSKARSLSRQCYAVSKLCLEIREIDWELFSKPSRTPVTLGGKKMFFNYKLNTEHNASVLLAVEIRSLW